MWTLELYTLYLFTLEGMCENLQNTNFALPPIPVTIEGKNGKIDKTTMIIKIATANILFFMWYLVLLSLFCCIDVLNFLLEQFVKK